MRYVIKHQLKGIYIHHEMRPRFTWKNAAAKGKRFSSKHEAEEVIAKFKMAQCSVEARDE